MAKKKPAPSENATPQAENPHYTVLARRYRPQQFHELIGQEPTAQALINALKSNRVAHAYLFTGTRGVGKTSAARILAKALNCVQGPTSTPCDQCEACRAIALGEDVDVVEIDGASNRNLDDIRELRSNLQYRPIRSRYKIYIIDEVHQLTKESFNALLKSLEEPPPHVKFIFATTDAHKVPITILSRCQRFDFAGIASKRILDRLRDIVTAEEAEAEPEALELIARRGAGSMRDAQSLLDQVLAFGGGKLTAEMVHQLLGTADEEQVVKLAAAVLGQDARRALELLGEGFERGVQIGELFDQLMEYWRDLMVVKTAGPEFEGITLSPRFRDSLRDQAEKLSLDAILAGLDLLAAAKARLRGTAHGRVLAEVLMVRMTQLENLLSLSELAQRLESGVSAQQRPMAAGLPRQTAPAAAPASALSKKNAEPALIDESTATKDIVQQPLTEVNLPAIWRQVLANVGPMLASELEKASAIAISAPNCVVLRFSTRYNKEVEHCQEPARVEKLCMALERLTGQKTQVRFELVGTPEAPAAAAGKPGSTRTQSTRQHVAQQPLVRQAMELFDAQLLKWDEDYGSTAKTDSETAPEDTNDHA